MATIYAHQREGEITDRQIADLRASLPKGHYALQWTIDAVTDPPGRRRSNARRECAILIAWLAAASSRRRG